MNKLSPAPCARRGSRRFSSSGYACVHPNRSPNLYKTAPYLNPVGGLVAGLTLEEGKKLIAIARASIERYMKERKPADVTGSPARLMEKSGAFVTLETYPEKDLRGCIGFIMAVKPLAQTVAECAVSAAVGDPRFRAVDEKELNALVVEVSVLTPLMKVGVEKPEHYVKAVDVGKHGLFIEDGYYS